MDNSVNNISFKANIVTKMNGRYRLINKVSKSFAEKTKNIPGEMCIYRNAKEYPKAIIFSYKNKDYILRDYADLMGNDLSSKAEVTDKLVDKVTKTFVNIFNALKADVIYDMQTAELVANIRSTKNALKNNTYMANKLQDKGLDKLAENFKVLVGHNERRLAKLRAELEKFNNNYRTKLEKMAEKEPKLEVWASVISSDLK
ncbi:MAG: hypothetical protein E7Z92_02505 [Cyanobacteria bacterium SIG31]|nr:hypothetical protein [Cyanobacteria bacterium SIG31]